MARNASDGGGKQCIEHAAVCMMAGACCVEAVRTTLVSESGLVTRQSSS